jgi:hypothetical protein
MHFFNVYTTHLTAGNVEIFLFVCQCLTHVCLFDQYHERKGRKALGFCGSTTGMGDGIAGDGGHDTGLEQTIGNASGQGGRIGKVCLMYACMQIFHLDLGLKVSW